MSIFQAPSMLWLLIVLILVPDTRFACFFANSSTNTWLDGYFVVLSVNVAVSLFDTLSFAVNASSTV